LEATVILLRVLAVRSAVVEKVSLAIPEERVAAYRVAVALLAYMQQDRREDGKHLGLLLVRVEYRTQRLAAWECQASELFAEALRVETLCPALTHPTMPTRLSLMVLTYAEAGECLREVSMTGLLEDQEE
tara:strand:+ start:291 stop:680 length:390 start_codon:yes stop_codon:yes gene_type:complete